MNTKMFRRAGLEKINEICFKHRALDAKGKIPRDFYFSEGGRGVSGGERAVGERIIGREKPEIATEKAW